MMTLRNDMLHDVIAQWLYRVWSRNGREGCSDMLHDVIIVQMVYCPCLVKLKKVIFFVEVWQWCLRLLVALFILAYTKCCNLQPHIPARLFCVKADVSSFLQLTDNIFVFGKFLGLQVNIFPCSTNNGKITFGSWHLCTSSISTLLKFSLVLTSFYCILFSSCQ